MQTEDEEAFQERRDFSHASRQRGRGSSASSMQQPLLGKGWE